jgi:nickel-dependent lactate racemase
MARRWRDLLWDFTYLCWNLTMIIGNKYTPVRKVVDRAGSMVTVPKLAFCVVVDHAQLAGLFVGSPENAWDQASDLSRTLHITYKEHPFHTVLSCAPAMYDELWVGGKCMYKLEPVVADGGELIIYAPHIHEISLTHGALIRRIGYRCRDYFLKQWDKYKDISWGGTGPFHARPRHWHLRGWNRALPGTGDARDRDSQRDLHRDQPWLSRSGND